MNIFAIVAIIFLVLVIAAWLVYNFWWLNQPQVYLVYDTSSATSGVSFPFDTTKGQNLATSLGGNLATLEQFADSFHAGASNCTFGYVECKDSCKDSACAGLCATGVLYNTLLPLNIVGVTGHTPNCGYNNAINGNAANASGYWIYGPKPSASVIDSWTIAPFHQKLGDSDYDMFNKYEILGIPKVL